jgi:hypothetical protein
MNEQMNVFLICFQIQGNKKQKKNKKEIAEEINELRESFFNSFPPSSTFSPTPSPSTYNQRIRFLPSFIFLSFAFSPFPLLPCPPLLPLQSL